MERDQKVQIHVVGLICWHLNQPTFLTSRRIEDMLKKEMRLCYIWKLHWKVASTVEANHHCFFLCNTLIFVARLILTFLEEEHLCENGKTEDKERLSLFPDSHDHDCHWRGLSLAGNQGPDYCLFATLLNISPQLLLAIANYIYYFTPNYICDVFI